MGQANIKSLEWGSFYEQGLVISNQVDIWQEQAGSLNRAIRSLHEQATGLSSDAYVIWGGRW